MNTAEIVNKVWNYAHVLRVLRSLSGIIKYFLNSVLVTLQKPFRRHQIFPELRSGHDGVGYGDYVEQITYLIFLKMANERGKGDMPSPRLSPGGRGGALVARDYMAVYPL